MPLSVRIDTIDLEAPEHASSCRLLAFWQARCGGGKILTTAQIPAREIVDLTGHLFLLEPCDGEGLDWRFRLAGSSLISRFGFSAKGKRISEIYEPAQAALSAGKYREVTQSLRPRVTKGRFLGMDRDFINLENVHLPIRRASSLETWILGGIFFFD